MLEEGYVTIMVSNMDRAIKFYTKTLGLKLENRYGNHWAEIAGPGITIGLHPVKSKKEIKAGSLSIGFSVKNLEKAIRVFKKKGLAFKVHEEEAVKLAFFQDPDKTELYLCEAKY